MMPYVTWSFQRAKRERERDGMPNNPFMTPEHEDNTPDTPGVESLSEYISKHLQKRMAPEQRSEEAPPSQPLFRHETPTSGGKSNAAPSGMILHHLDSQLANGHLERYLPTAATRYHLARERISDELNAVYEALKHYRQFHGSEYDDKIEALEQRATLLKRKLFELERSIAKLNPFQSMYSALQKFPLKPPGMAPKNGWMLIPNPQQELRNEVIHLSQELEAIQTLLEDQLHDPALTPQQLGRLINEYDINLRKAEKLMDELKNRKSLTSRLGETFSQWYGKLTFQR